MLQVSEFPHEFRRGPLNRISDVKGVRVGHATLSQGDIQTGVTAILPANGIFKQKLPAACHVVNGFGKTAGLVQIEELGTLESPLLLTNTLAVGFCWQALCEHLIAENSDLRSVNPLVCECNDSHLNDIRHQSITGAMVQEAIQSAAADFKQGAVGAGRGMICHGLKGGIGSASRLITVDKDEYALGALVLSNHGRMRDLVIHGKRIGPQIEQRIKELKTRDEGSVIVILATDLPLSPLQLKRVCHRAVVGLSLTGSKIGHGSGEIIIAFSTANPIDAQSLSPYRELRELQDSHMDGVFRMTIECVEEAVINSLLHAEKVTGFENHSVEALSDWIETLG